jgi:hypothetical protein
MGVWPTLFTFYLVVLGAYLDHLIVLGFGVELD